MENEIAIKVKNVSKTFRIPHEKISSLRGAAINIFKTGGFEEFQALDDVSFEVKKGEFFGIIGRNGSGKSTLLKILAGIYQSDQGSVKIDGRISPFLELGIGFNPELSGRDNIYLNATVLGLTKKQIDAKFDSIVAFSELARFIDQKLKNYSSGMSVRLAFSVAIHANREILLMDEVLAVGDMNFQSKCLEEFNRYKEMGKTVILVSHDIFTVQKYCDRAMLLRNGKIVKIGKAEEVGNAYVYENMSDEEKRIEKDEKNKKNVIPSDKDVIPTNSTVIPTGVEGSNFKSQKIAEITKVKFLDKNGKEKNVFETGELLNIEIEYKFREIIKDPIFGIIIRNEARSDVFALNTMHKRINTGSFEKGMTKVSFSIKNYFATGIYSVSPAIATRNQINIDWKDNFKSFRVINKEFNSQAIADFETNIIIK